LNKYLLSFLKYLLLFEIAGGLLYLAFQGVDIERTIDAVFQADY